MILKMRMFSCYGTPLVLDFANGWFTYEGCKGYKEKIKFIISMHGRFF